MTRKTSAILILAGGILAAFFIARLAAPEKGDGALSLVSQGGVDSLFDFKSGGKGTDIQANLTEEVARRYGEEVLKLNERGAGTQGLYVPNEAALETLIQAEVGRGFAFEKIFIGGDFRTEDDNTAAATQKYLEALGEVPEGSTGMEFLPSVAAAVASGDPEPLEAHMRAGEKYLEHLLTITVPSDWIGFHTRVANIWQKRVELSGAILAMEDDPLRAIVALQTIPKTAEEEIELLSILKDLLSKTS